MEESEAWRPIVGFEGRYDVSSWGRVRSLKVGKILKPAPQSSGYLCVALHRSGEKKWGRSFCVHQLVATAFLGPCPDGLQVNHKDANKRNNRPDNLEYVTPLQNVRHAVANGRFRQHWSGLKGHKLTADQVIEALKRASAGERHADIAHDLSVDPSTISEIVRGESWKHLQRPA